MREIALRFDNAWAALRRHGPVNYSRRLLFYFGRFAYKRHRAIVFRRDLTEPVDILDASAPLEFEFYSGNRNGDLHAFLDHHLRIDVVEARLRDGWTPVLAYYRGTVVSVSWFNTSPIYLDTLECNLDYGPGAGYIEGSITSEDMRGTGIAPAIRSRICRHLRGLGCKIVYVSAGEDNKASHAVARKCGFTPFETIEVTRVLWHRRYRRRRLLREDTLTIRRQLLSPDS